MTDLTKFFENGATLEAVLGAEAAELIDLARQLSKVLPDLQTDIADADDPWAVYAAIRSGIDDPAIERAFAAAGAAALFAQTKAFAAKFDEVLPPEVEILLRSLGDYDESASGADSLRSQWATGDDKGQIAWDKAGKLLSAAQADGSAMVYGAIAASVEAGSLWFYSQDNVPSKGLFRIGLSGALGATVQGSVPFGSVGSVTAGASAGVAAQVHLFWRRPVDHIVAEVIADIALHPVNIFSLEEMLAACHGRAGMEGLIMAIDGHASLDIDLAIARDIDVEGFFSATAGLTVRIGLARRAAYELSLRKVPTGIRLALTHADDDARKWGVGIGIEIDAAPVARRVGAVMQSALEHWDAVLDDLKPFLSPGTWLQKQAGVQLGKLTSEIGDKAIVGALRNDLQLALGNGGDSDARLAALLSTKVLDAISGLEGAVTGKAQTLAKQAVARLAMQLPAVAQNPIKTKLEAEIEALIADYQSELTQFTGSLAKTQAVKVERALKQLGAKVTSGAAAANAHAKELRNLVEKADRLVRKVAAEVEGAAKAKIAARMRFERQRLNKEHYEVAGTFTAPTPEASALYTSLLMGRLNGAAAMFAADSLAVPGFTPERELCSVRRFSKVSKTLGYEIVLLGMDFTGRSEASGMADITLDGEDRITVYTRSIATREAMSINTSRKSEYVQTGALLLAKAEGGERPADLQMSFAIRLFTQRRDKQLKVGEVRNFLALMVECGLLSPVRAVAASDYLTKAIGNGGGRKLSGTVIVEMELSTAEVANIAQLGMTILDKPEKSRSIDARIIFDVALDALFTTGEWRRADFDWFVTNFVKAKYPYPTTADPIREKLFANLDQVASIATGYGPRGVGAPNQNRFADGKRRCDLLVDLLALARQTAAMQLATPSRRREGEGATWGLREYRTASLAIAESAGAWIGLNQFAVFLFGERMDQRTAALMLALARLAKGATDTGSSIPGADSLFHVALVLDKVDAQGF